jgi:hypothetical protein
LVGTTEEVDAVIYRDWQERERALEYGVRGVIAT